MAATEKTDNFWSPQNELATNKILLQVTFVTKSVSKCAPRSKLLHKINGVKVERKWTQSFLTVITSKLIVFFVKISNIFFFMGKLKRVFEIVK